MATETHIALSIISIFILIGIMMPYLQNDLGIDRSEYQISSITDQISEDNATTTNAWMILKSVFLMFFWTFGGLPFWIDAIFIVFRISLVLSLAKMIRG